MPAQSPRSDRIDREKVVGRLVTIIKCGLVKEIRALRERTRDDSTAEPDSRPLLQIYEETGGLLVIGNTAVAKYEAFMKYCIDELKSSDCPPNVSMWRDAFLQVDVDNENRLTAVGTSSWRETWARTESDKASILYQFTMRAVKRRGFSRLAVIQRLKLAFGGTHYSTQPGQSESEGVSDSVAICSLSPLALDNFPLESFDLLDGSTSDEEWPSCPFDEDGAADKHGEDVIEASNTNAEPVVIDLDVEEISSGDDCASAPASSSVRAVLETVTACAREGIADHKAQKLTKRRDVMAARKSKKGEDTKAKQCKQGKKAKQSKLGKQSKTLVKNLKGKKTKKMHAEVAQDIPKDKKDPKHKSQHRKDKEDPKDLKDLKDKNHDKKNLEDLKDKKDLKDKNHDKKNLKDLKDKKDKTAVVGVLKRPASALMVDADAVRAADVVVYKNWHFGSGNACPIEDRKNVHIRNWVERKRHLMQIVHNDPSGHVVRHVAVTVSQFGSRSPPSCGGRTSGRSLQPPSWSPTGSQSGATPSRRCMLDSGLI